MPLEAKKAYVNDGGGRIERSKDDRVESTRDGDPTDNAQGDLAQAGVAEHVGESTNKDYVARYSTYIFV